LEHPKDAREDRRSSLLHFGGATEPV